MAERDDMGGVSKDYLLSFCISAALPSLCSVKK